MRVFESRVLGRIFGPTRDEVTGGLRKLHNEEFRNLYSSPNIMLMITSWNMRWAGHVGRMEIEFIQIFGGKARRLQTDTIQIRTLEHANRGTHNKK
jgi:hypothetical protein